MLSSCGPTNPNAYLPLPFDSSKCTYNEPDTQTLYTDTSNVVYYPESSPMPWSTPLFVSGNAEFL